MKKIILTGANGFLGSAITAQSLAQDLTITPLVRKGSNIGLLPENSKIRYIDYSREADLEEALSGHQILIHNAGLTRAVNWQKYKSANLDLTEKLVKIFNHTDSLQQFIFISSQAAVGPSRAGVPLTEEQRPQPVSLYGKSKLLAEDYIRTNLNGNWTIIRPASVFGPGDKDFLQLYKMVKRHLMFYPVQKEKIFSIIYAEDLARLILSCAGNKKAYDQIFFAANPEPLKLTEMIGYLEQIMTTFSNSFVIPGFWINLIAQIFELYSKLSGKLSVINKERVQEFKLPDWQVSGKKAAQILGFEPQFEIYEALYKTWKWYEQTGWL